jgi:hypothetical protein
LLLRAAPRSPAPIPVEAWARAYGLARDPRSGRHAISLIGPGPDFSPEYAGSQAGRETRAALWTAHTLAQTRIEALRAEWDAARRNALDAAIAPLLELAAPLRTGAQRDALAAYVIRPLSDDERAAVDMTARPHSASSSANWSTPRRRQDPRLASWAAAPQDCRSWKSFPGRPLDFALLGTNVLAPAWSCESAMFQGVGLWHLPGI